MLVARIACERQDEETALLSARKAVSLNPDDFASLHMCCEIEMAFGLFADAAERLTGDAPVSHLQRHIALRCTALRGIGDQSYRKWFDYSRFVSETTIETPAGYPTLDAFNRDLGIAIATLHQGSAHPIDQTLFGGTQSFGTLWQQPEQIFQDFAEVMRGAVSTYVEALPNDDSHPFLRRKRGRISDAGSWSVILQSGGGHVDHIHPAGWVSATYYVKIPPEVEKSNRQGCLRLGASGVRGVDLDAELRIAPAPGKVVFFPSYMWHGVDAFRSQNDRIAAPFDIGSA